MDALERDRVLTYIAQMLAERGNISEGSPLDMLFRQHVSAALPVTSVDDVNGWRVVANRVNIDDMDAMGDELVNFVADAIICGAVPFRGTNLIDVACQLAPEYQVLTGFDAAKAISAATLRTEYGKGDCLVRLIQRWIANGGTRRTPLPGDTLFVPVDGAR